MATPIQTRSPGVLARRLLDAVGLTTADGVPAPFDEFLRLCLNCRGYSCPVCWNEDAGLCQTCVPLPEPAPLPEPEPELVIAEPMIEEPVAAEPDIAVAELATAIEQAQPDAFVAEPESEPEPVAAQPPAAEPVAAEAQPVDAEPVAPAESEAEPVPAPALAPEPVRPRMPILPVPPPRRPTEPTLPLPTDIPVAPAIRFDHQPNARLAPREYPQYAYLPVPGRPAAPTPGLRACRNCDLALSARAHFCRRCGTRQPD